MLELCITTAPREIPTLKACISALRSAGWQERINVFSEPGKLEVEDSNMLIHVNKKKLGAFDNYDNVLNWFLNRSNKEYVVIMQDDFIVCKEVFNILKRIDYTEDFGYYNLYTCAENPSNEFIKKPNWNVCKLGHYAWGACYMMSRKTVERLVKADYYTKHKQGISDGNKGQMIDGAVSESMLQLNLPMYYHNPSLTQHIGYSSTLSHNGMLTGLNFKINYMDYNNEEVRWEQLKKLIPNILENKTMLYVGGHPYHSRRLQMSKYFEKAGIEIDVVEAFEKNATAIKEWKWIHEVFNADIRFFEPKKKYDIIMFWHGVEHLPKNEVVLLTVKLKEYCKLLVYATPNGKYEQGEEYGNPFEKHVSHWTAKDFEELGMTASEIGKPNEKNGNVIAYLKS